jgi:hypothetical protein
MADPKDLQPSTSLGGGATDLPADLMQRIDAVHERLAHADYYALLGLPRTATRAQVRQAFLAHAPQFHPDKYFGRNLGPYGPKMQRVFAHLSAAHDTLVDDERRAIYTRGLPPPVAAPPPTASPPAGTPTGATPTPSATRTTDVSGAIARARQQAFAAKLTGPKRVPTPMPGSVAIPARPGSIGTPVRPFEALRPQTSPGGSAADPKAAVDALRRRYEESVRGRNPIALVQAAESAAAKGDYAEAARLYRAATEHSSDPNLRAVLVETETMAKGQLHAEATKRAKEAEGKQEHQQAGMEWARAFDLIPAAETGHRASLCFRRGGTDLRRAAKYGEEAVKLDPNKATYRVNLALVYADLGMGLRARGEIDRAHGLDPQSPQVKEAITRIKHMK